MGRSARASDFIWRGGSIGKGKLFMAEQLGARLAALSIGCGSPGSPPVPGELRGGRAMIADDRGTGDRGTLGQPVPLFRLLGRAWAESFGWIGGRWISFPGCSWSGLMRQKAG
jgi:hypothetical protein